MWRRDLNEEHAHTADGTESESYSVPDTSAGDLSECDANPGARTNIRRGSVPELRAGTTAESWIELGGVDMRFDSFEQRECQFTGACRGRRESDGGDRSHARLC